MKSKTNKGLLTVDEVCAIKGVYWEDLQDQIIADEVWFQKVLKSAGVTRERLLVQLRILRMLMKNTRVEWN